VIREGKGYVQRRVDVTQEEENGVIFTCVCSFKTPEANVNERLKKKSLEEYQSVFQGKAIDSLPEAPGVDSPL
jgi:acyl-CoA thioesterase